MAGEEEMETDNVQKGWYNVILGNIYRGFCLNK